MMTPRRSAGSSWQALPNLRVEAQYHFDLQLPTVEDCDQTKLIAMQQGLASPRHRLLRLAVHEYTHWTDHVASTWGRQLLAGYARAVRARNQDDPAHFHHIVAAHRAVSRASLQPYYFMLGPASSVMPPWRWTLSVGQRFDSSGRLNRSDPILFIRFLHPDTGELVARVPFSPGALAEARAMFAEFSWVQREHEVRAGETPASPSHWLSTYAAELYSVDSTLYTVAAHLLANTTGLTDLREVMPYSSALAWFALNATPTLATRLSLPSEWCEQWEKGSSDVLSPLVSNADPGLVFAALAATGIRPRGQSPDAWLNEVLERNAAMTLVDAERVWQESQEQLFDSIEPEPLPWYGTLAAEGRAWARAYGPSGSPVTLLDTLDRPGTLRLPATLLAEDETYWHPTGPIPGDEDSAGRREEAMECSSRLGEFLLACGV
jgi:hypothetical protein